MLAVMADRHTVLVIIGPSGSGKSTLVEELHRRGLIHVLPTCTTRPPRPGEVGDGTSVPTHHFTSDRVFDDLCRRGILVHTGTIEGLPYRYGLPPIWPRATGPVDTVVLRAPYVDRFRAAVPGCLVYEVDAPEQVLAARLAGRGGSPAELGARLRDNARARLQAAKAPVADRHFTATGSVTSLADAVAWAMAIDFPGRSPAFPVIAAGRPYAPVPNVQAAAPTTGVARERRGARVHAALRLAGLGLAAVVGACGLLYLLAVLVALVCFMAGVGSNK